MVGDKTMGKVLVIKGTPQSEAQSRSTQVLKGFINEYKENNHQDDVIELDLYNMKIPLIDADVLNGWNKLRAGENLTNLELVKITAIDQLTEQFIEADKYIIQSSMWNLGIQPLLKAYIDTVSIAGKTFNYTKTGPKGLMEGKKGIHIHGSGGIYSGTVGIEHCDSYITGILRFLGIEVLPTIFVEGIDYQPEQQEAIIAAALQKAIETAQYF